MGEGGGNVPLPAGGAICTDDFFPWSAGREVSPSLKAADDWHPKIVAAPVDMRNAVRDPDMLGVGGNRQGTGMGGLDDPSGTLSCCSVPGVAQVERPVAIAPNVIGRGEANGGHQLGVGGDVAYTQDAFGTQGVCHRSCVRRLVPVECERLMGFPDGWTLVPVKEHTGAAPAARQAARPDLFIPREGGGWIEYAGDAPRYKACGNSMCVNVMRWIGMRIEMADRRMGGRDAR